MYNMYNMETENTTTLQLNDLNNQLANINTLLMNQMNIRPPQRLSVVWLNANVNAPPEFNYDFLNHDYNLSTSESIYSTALSALTHEFSALPERDRIFHTSIDKARPNVFHFILSDDRHYTLFSV